MAAGQSRWKCLCWCCAYRQVYHYQHLPRQLLQLATHWLWWILQPPHQVGDLISINFCVNVNFMFIPNPHSFCVGYMAICKLLDVCCLGQLPVNGNDVQRHHCIAEEADAAQRSNAGGHGKAASSAPAPRQRLPSSSWTAMSAMAGGTRAVPPRPRDAGESPQVCCVTCLQGHTLVS